MEPVYARANDRTKAIEEFYGGGETTERLIKSLEEIKVEKGGQDDIFKMIGGESPIAKLVDLILTQAARDRASDVHIEPEEEFLRIRFRIDGVLHEIPSPPKHLELAIISRVKVLCGMDIAESRVPQDGHFQVTVDGRLAMALWSLNGAPNTPYSSRSAPRCSTRVT